MCARLAYPKGLASELVTATSSRGHRMRREGMTGGMDWFFGVLKYRYRAPVRAAKSDWIVLRKTGYLNFSVAVPNAPPCGVVVSFSCRYAHVRLRKPTG